MQVGSQRFGQLEISDSEVIQIPQGVFGFPELTRFCLVDPADDTLILWLQSLDRPEVAFPVLEPKVFRPDYAVRLSAAELRELQLENVGQAAVFSILTIPADVGQMTANLKAPIVINLARQTARQVVLQENEYSVRHLMFKELKAHLMTMAAQVRAADQQQQATSTSLPVTVRSLPPSSAVRPLNA